MGSGPTVGGVRDCSITGLTPATDYRLQIAAYRGDDPSTAVFGQPSAVVTTRTSGAGAPETVNDLRVKVIRDDRITLDFSMVDDGTGARAKFEVRHAPTPIGWGWGSATVDSAADCNPDPFIAATWACTIAPLAPGSSYDFQVVTYRGTLNQDAVFGGLSNVATGVIPTTRASGSGAVNLVSVDINATSTLTGTLKVADRNFLRDDGTPATATVDPVADTATRITCYQSLGTSCARFFATGRMDTGELVDMTIDLCDNSAAGGTDSVDITVPYFHYHVSGSLTSGDFAVTRF